MKKKARKTPWKKKTLEVKNCFYRCLEDKDDFARLFYENLFFLSPKIKKYFKNTDWEHQKKR